MATSSDSPAKEPIPTSSPEPHAPSPSTSTASTLPVDASPNNQEPQTAELSKLTLTTIDTKSASIHSRPSQEHPNKPIPLDQDVDNTAEFSGEVDTNNDLPSAATVKQIGDYTVLDKDGKSLPFRNIYSGPNVVRRVLVIFIRHFFCGNCQEYVRTLSATPSLSPSTLLSLSPPTFICIIGCGSPSLIPMYISQTSCPYPVYTDPTKQLYNTLGMIRTFSLGKNQPGYITKSMLGLAVKSVVQGVKEAGKGKLFTKNMEWGGGDIGQVGGEFLFESVNGDFSPGGISPGETPVIQINNSGANANGSGKGDDYLKAGEGREDEKVVTWCHRMRNTRDHAEVETLRVVLGVDDESIGKRTEVGKRKLTGMSARSVGSSMGGEKHLDVTSEVVVR